jgi:hypothetical protein
LRSCQARNCLFVLSCDMPTMLPSSRWVMRTLRFVPEASTPPVNSSETRRKAQIHHILDLFAGPADAGAQGFDELECDVGLAMQHGDEIAPIDHHQLAIGHCDPIGRARPAVEQGDLAECLPGIDDVEYSLVAGRLGEDRRAAPHRAPRHVAAQHFDDGRWKFAKQRMIAQWRELIDRTERGLGSARHRLRLGSSRSRRKGRSAPIRGRAVLVRSVDSWPSSSMVEFHLPNADAGGTRVERRFMFRVLLLCLPMASVLPMGG